MKKSTPVSQRADELAEIQTYLPYPKTILETKALNKTQFRLGKINV